MRRDVGAKIALVEKDRIGSDCTRTGCVPSKALLHAVKTIHTARQAQHFTQQAPAIKPDMRKVRAYVEQTIQNVYARESPDMLRAEGIDVVQGAPLLSMLIRFK